MVSQRTARRLAKLRREFLDNEFGASLPAVTQSNDQG